MAYLKLIRWLCWGCSVDLIFKIFLFSKHVWVVLCAICLVLILDDILVSDQILSTSICFVLFLKIYVFLFHFLSLFTFYDFHLIVIPFFFFLKDLIVIPCFSDLWLNFIYSLSSHIYAKNLFSGSLNNLRIWSMMYLIYNID